MKNILSFVLLITLTLSICSITACKLFGSDDSDSESSTTAPPSGATKIFEYTLNSNGYYLEGAYLCDTDLIVPSEHEGNPVIGISAGAIKNQEDLTRVTLPLSIKVIEQGAFADCPNLTSIKYLGTVAEWDTVDKDVSWYLNCPIYSIECSDDTICLHKFSNWKTAKNPSTTEEGLKERFCSLCGKIETLTIPPVKDTVTIAISTTYGAQELFEKQLEDFLAEYPEYLEYEFKFVLMGEGDAVSTVLKNLSQAPDIYCFAQDALPRLALNGALSTPNPDSASIIKNSNDAASVNAASFENSVWAYPFTSDNGYFMYYDTSIITNPDSLEQIIADVEAYNAAHPGSPKYICYNLSNSWYSAGFFFATGCTSSWTPDSKRGFSSVTDTFNSENGIISLKAMQKLFNSSAFVSSEYSNHPAVCISGVWDYEIAKRLLKDNMGITDLPSFSYDGKEYHLGSYSGHKLMGVKPQESEEREELLHLLAAYLTSEECQLERYDELKWIPSNLNAQQNERVKSDPCLSALVQQAQHSVPQGEIPMDWWGELAKLINSASTALTDDDLRAALQAYEEKLSQMLTK